MNEFYYGWNPIGNWIRLSVDVKEPGTYKGGIYYTAPNCEWPWVVVVMMMMMMGGGEGGGLFRM